MALYFKNKGISAKGKIDVFEPLSLRGKFVGQSCFLCGTGPSIKKAPKSLIESSGNTIIGLNNSFVYIEPSIWIGTDEPASFDPSLFNSSFRKIYQWQRRLHKFKKKKICDYDNFYFFIRADPSDTSQNGVNFSADHINFIFEGNTFSSAIHILYWMGFSTVYLIGCDFGGSNAISRMGPYYENHKYNIKSQKSHLSGAIDFLRFSSENNGVKYISCTPKSPINKFLEYISIEDVIRDEE